MTHQEYIERLWDILGKYILYDQSNPSIDVYTEEAITAILALNDEAVGGDEQWNWGDTKNGHIGFPARNALRQEIKRVIGSESTNGEEAEK